MKRVLVLGNNGMLGSMVSHVLDQHGHTVLNTSRSGAGASFPFTVGNDSIRTLLEGFTSLDYIVNAIGVIKPRINEADSASRVNAININAMFPHELANAAEYLSIPVIQIATDCVYSGLVGAYDEDAPHDPTDIYGKTKSLGEVPSNKVLHLRASIIGPEVGRQTSLWEWVRNQPKDASINGFTNHFWNGVTTYHFGLICNGIISSSSEINGKQHLIPTGKVTKAELVRCIAKKSGRNDIAINDAEAADAVDRTLSTNNEGLNKRLWSLAGFETAPTVEEMVNAVPLEFQMN